MDPILFYKHVPLYEDELADNGISMLDVKIRVMNASIFVLSRFFMRIDNVLFRIRDTRLFIDLAQCTILEQSIRMEMPFDQLNDTFQHIPDRTHLFRDPSWLVTKLNTVSKSVCEMEYRSRLIP